MAGMGAHGALVKRLSLVAGFGALALVAGVVGALGALASAALPWALGTLLAAAVVALIVLGFHAGGHAWFVPVPVLVLAALWAIAASAGKWASPLAWALAAFAFAGAIGGAVLVIPALAYRRATPHALGGAALVGATGTAVSPLTPRGVARVKNETWTVESLSGPLPAGAPIHVAKVEGVRLLVWSEAGTVPGPEALSPARKEKEEP